MRILSPALLALALSASIAQAQRTPDPAALPSHQLAAPAHPTRSTAHPLAEREEACRIEAARGITSTPENLPQGTRRATAVEFSMREQLCLKKAAEADEAQLLSHRHYTNKDGVEVHAPAKPSGDQVPVGASAKCRDGTWSFSQHRRGLVRITAA